MLHRYIVTSFFFNYIESNKESKKNILYRYISIKDNEVRNTHVTSFTQKTFRQKKTPRGVSL